MALTAFDDHDVKRRLRVFGPRAGRAVSVVLPWPNVLIEPVSVRLVRVQPWIAHPGPRFGRNRLKRRWQRSRRMVLGYGEWVSPSAAWRGAALSIGSSCKLAAGGSHERPSALQFYRPDSDRPER
jgi:hypothetical protein